MRLPHLDQCIHLHWGEAQQLAASIEWIVLEAVETVSPARITGSMATRLGPLVRVRGRLRNRTRREAAHVGPTPKKPWKLTLRYDEVAALIGILDQAPPAGLAWGEIQRASLNLERFIDFTR